MAAARLLGSRLPAAFALSGKVSPAKGLSPPSRFISLRFLAENGGASQGLPGAAQAVTRSIGGGSAQGIGGGSGKGFPAGGGLILSVGWVVLGAVLGLYITREEEDLIPVDELPESVDWELNGAVTPPAYQLKCGSCYAHAGVSAIESIDQITFGGPVRSFSVQGVIDCAKEDGCDGGFAEDVFKYAMEHGLNSAKDYPQRFLLGGKGKCKSEGLPVVCYISGYRFFMASETKLMQHVVRQPIFIAVDVFPDEAVYDGTIIELSQWPPAKEKKGQHRHAVLVVGYGKDEKGDLCWKLKNSRGPLWGKDGYSYPRRGTGNKQGVGGMYRYLAYYPIIVQYQERRFPIKDWYGWWGWWDI